MLFLKNQKKKKSKKKFVFKYIATYYDSFHWWLCQLPIEIKEKHIHKEIEQQITHKIKKLENGLPEICTVDDSVDLTASCPRCLAAEADKPGGSEGEFNQKKNHLIVISWKLKQIHKKTGILDFKKTFTCLMFWWNFFN